MRGTSQPSSGSHEVGARAVDAVVVAPPLAAPASTRHGARGSAKVAVPTCDGVGARDEQLDGVAPAATPPTPDDRRRSGKAARHRRRPARRPGERRPRQPAATGAEHASGARSGSIAMPSRVLTSVSASAPASSAAPAISTRSATFGAQLGPRGAARMRAAAATASAVAAGEWANIRRAVLEVRAADVHLDGDDRAARAGEHRGRRGVLLDACGPRCWRPPCAPVARARAARRSSHAPTPGPCRPTRVEHAAGVSVHPRRRVARPRLGRERLHHDRAERRRGRRRRPARRRARPCPTRSSPGWASVHRRPTDGARGRRPRSSGDRVLTAWQLLEARAPTSGCGAQSAMPAAAARAAATVVRHGTWWAERGRVGCGRRRRAARGPGAC